jgi:hypothetical protein
MSDAEQNGDSIEVEVPAITTPTFPVEQTLNNSQAFFQRTIGGGMLLKVVPLITTPRGVLPAHEATVIVFSADGWDRFKRAVAADGDAPPQVETALHIPGGLLNGEGR